MPIERLITGFRRFRETYYEGEPDFYKTLVEKGQSPDVMVIACSDSRVNPSIIAQARPGELFIVRNVANLVPPYQPDGRRHGTSAALEFAVRDLGVKDIIVLGHSHCGGIRRLCDGAHAGAEREFIDDWISIVEEARDAREKGEDYFRSVEKNAVIASLNNLDSFPWVSERVQSSDLRVHGWIFDLEAGYLLSYDGGGVWTNLSR